MGLVFQGMDKSLDRPVAIKQMRPELQLLPRDKSSFLREAKTSASLHHPFIVDIYEILESDNEVFLIFEFVEGMTIDQLLEEKDRVAPAQAKRVLRDVCEALSYAHSRKIAHRDLKPSNIMVGPQGHAKVMDFGIARMMKDTTSRVTSVDTSGTLAYMAPEQELGKSNLRSDIFSLGATAYEMLSGERPFPGPNYYLQKEKMSFRPLADAAPGVPGELAAAVERCLNFDAKLRYQTADEFARAIGVADAP
jgi:serine/threonine-protein kinase